MAKIGRICGACGNIGQIEKSCSQVSAENQPGIWLCQNCRKRQTEMAERRKSDKAGPPKRFENSKVKFLSTEDVISISNGAFRPCIRRTTTSRTSSMKTATPSASSSGSKETGHKEHSTKGRLPYHLDPIAWKGSLEVHDLFGSILVELAAFLPLQVSAKLCGAIETLPAKLQMRMVPHFGALPKRFDADFPKFKDIGVFLLPLDRSSRLKTIHLLRQLDSRKHALKMKVNASHELVVHSSQLLAENSQRIEGDLFLWGFFWNCKIRSDSKRKKYSSPNVTPGKTCSEFRKPIAQDKRSDVLKSDQVVKEVIVDTSDVCGNNSLEKEAAVDTFDVPPGFTKLPIGQEISPIDRQPETSMPGKETQLSYKEVVPGYSSFSSKNNKESGRKRLFSSIGAGILEAMLEGCENQEEYPEQAPGLTNETSEKKEKSKQAFEQPDASPGIPSNLDVCDIVADKMPQQLESPPAFHSSGQKLIKLEKEPLVPLPISPEISPGYSRIEVGARKENRISNQHLETPPGFVPLGGALIKQEQDSFPLLVGLRSIEERKEKNFSSQCQGSQPSMNQVLNVHNVVPDYFMDRPLLENQGIIHQQLPVGKRTIVFNYPAIQATTSHSCDIQPTSPGGIHAAIPKVSVNHSQSIPMPTNYIQNYSEQSKSTSSMHATGEIQRVHNSLTTPDMKYKDTSFSQMVAQSRDEFNHLCATLYNVKELALTPALSHFRVLNPSFLESSSRDGYHSPINKKTADITAIAREEESQRDYVRESPVWSRERSRSTSPVPRRYRSRSRSPVPRRCRSRSGSPVPRRYRSRSRSPVPRRYRSRSRSPLRRQHRSRSRSPIRRRHRSRTRSPIRRWHRSQTKSPVRRRYRSCSKSPVSRRHRSPCRNTSRGNKDPVYRQNRSWVRSPGQVCNVHDSEQNSSQYKGWCSSRSRGGCGSDDSSLSRNRGRDRSRSLSPPPPIGWPTPSS